MRTGDPSVPEPADGHTHGHDDEYRQVVRIMESLRIGCGNLGEHRHEHRTAEGRTSWAQHHHHDIRCLVEAGANVGRAEVHEQFVKPLAEEASRQGLELMRTQAELRGVKQMLTQVQKRCDDLQGQVESLRWRDRIRGVFMRQHPAVGPWDTIEDLWTDWLAEQVDEQALAHLARLARLEQTEQTEQEPCAPPEPGDQ
jgi:hypothetical protein